jgi:hypothetical protein
VVGDREDAGQSHLADEGRRATGGADVGRLEGVRTCQVGVGGVLHGIVVVGTPFEDAIDAEALAPVPEADVGADLVAVEVVGGVVAEDILGEAGVGGVVVVGEREILPPPDHAEAMDEGDVRLPAHPAVDFEAPDRRAQVARGGVEAAPQTEDEDRLVGARIARAPGQLLDPFTAAGLDRHPAADAAPVALPTDRLDRQPVAPLGAVFEEGRREVLVGNDDIQIAIGIVVGGGNSPAHDLRVEVGASSGAALLEAPAVEDEHLGLHLEERIAGIVLHVAVGHEQFLSTVLVEVGHHGPEAESGERRFVEPDSAGDILESRRPEVAVEGVRLVVEMGGVDVEPAVAVVVADGEPHARRRHPVAVDRTAQEDR